MCFLCCFVVCWRRLDGVFGGKFSIFIWKRRELQKRQFIRKDFEASSFQNTHKNWTLGPPSVEAFFMNDAWRKIWLLRPIIPYFFSLFLINFDWDLSRLIQSTFDDFFLDCNSRIPRIFMSTNFYSNLKQMNFFFSPKIAQKCINLIYIVYLKQNETEKNDSKLICFWLMFHKRFISIWRDL